MRLGGIARAGACALACAGAAAVALSAQTPATSLEQVYRQLERPPMAEGAAVHAAAFTWAGLRFFLQDGELDLSGPVGGHVTAAVFTGHGALQVIPADAVERQQMLRFTGRGEIAVSFTTAVFRFADADQFQQVTGPLAWAPLPNAHTSESILGDRAKAMEKRGSPTVARLLQALEAPTPSHLLFAELEMPGHAWLAAQYDPSQPEPVRVYEWNANPIFGGAEYPNRWTQFAPKGTVAPAPLPHLDHYNIQAALTGHFDLDATVHCDLAATAPSGPGVILGLDQRLRLASVSAAGKALEFLQPQDADWFYLRLPQPLRAGQSLALEFQYRGKAPLMLGENGSDDAVSLPGWYPTGMLDAPWAELPSPATFDLNFKLDAKYRLLASGQSASPTEWRAPEPISSAGFAVGESQLDARTLALADGRSVALQLAVPKRGDFPAVVPLVGAKVTGVLNFMDHVFGPYPWNPLAVTVTAAAPDPPLPMVASLDPQSFLDVSPELTDVAPAISLAGQWWGAWTTPASIHDEWLVSGLRAASGLLYQQVESGPDASLPTLQQWQQALFQRSRLSRHIPILLGPLQLGAARLSSDEDDGAALLTLKGAYAIYMLRQMMLEPRQPDPDAAFNAMMRDFTAHFGGHPVRSADFQAVVERHMTPAMDLDHNHKMDWYFRPLLSQALIPILTFHAESLPSQHGVAQVKLTVENGQGWRGLLPVYFFKDPTTWVRGLMPITQYKQTLTVPVPFTPQFVEANHFLDMLLQVQGQQ